MGFLDSDASNYAMASTGIGMGPAMFNKAAGGKGIKGLVTGSVFSGDEDQAAKDYLDQMMQEYNGITPPKMGELQKYNALDYSPELINAGPDVQARLLEAQQANATDAGQSAMQGIALDPALRQQQMASMAALQDIASNGGMTAKDQANLSRIQTDNASADRGRRDAIQQGMASRGMGGSSMSLLAQLQSNQASTDRSAQQGLDVAGMAQQRALDAMAQSGTMAGGLRNQDFGEQSQKAQAADAINKFNVANKNQFAQYNANQRAQTGQQNAQSQMETDRFNRGNSMQAQQFNAGAKNQHNQQRQNMANQNVDMQNRQNVDLPQQNFQNQMSMASAKSGAAGQGLGYYQGQSNNAREGWRNMIAGGAQAGAAAAGKRG